MTMKEKTYEIPTCKIILLQHKTMLLEGSKGSVEPDNVSLWNGEGD